MAVAHASQSATKANRQTPVTYQDLLDDLATGRPSYFLPCLGGIQLQDPLWQELFQLGVLGFQYL